MPAVVETLFVHVEEKGVVYVHQLPETCILLPEAIRDLANEGVLQVVDWNGDTAKLELTFKNGVANYHVHRHHDDFGSTYFSAELLDWTLTI